MSRQNKVFYQKPQKNLQKPDTADNVCTNQSERTFTVKEPVEGGIKDWIANAIIVLLSISFVFLIIVAVAETADANHVWVMDEKEFWRYIANEDYPEIVNYVYQNENRGVTVTPTLKECYAVGKYFEAASLYKVAVQVNDTEDINKYSATMEECLKDLQDILYVVEDIDLKLGIN